MTYQPLSETALGVLAQLDVMERERPAFIEQMCYPEQDGRVSTDSAKLRRGPGLVLTPQAGAASRHEGKS